MAREASTKSKLIKLLHQISRGSTPRIGLVPTTEQPVPALALIVALDAADTQCVAAAVGAGADAVVLAPDAAIPRWDELAAASEKPIGLRLGDGDLAADTLKSYAGRADFLIADVEQAPAGMLDLEETGRVLVVDDDYAPHLIRTLGELPVDAVLAQSKHSGTAPLLTVRDVLHFRQVVDLVRRPVIGIADRRFGPRLLKLFRDMGIEAVLLPVVGNVGAEGIRNAVAEYRQAIDELGRPIGRTRDREQALVPHVRPVLAAAPEPEEEPDED